jgi:hypothetical protein
MIHDALSHHASQYKAALKAGRKDLANSHAKQIFRTVDLADQAQGSSDGKLHIEAVSPHPWERNAKAKTFVESDGPVQRGNKKVGQFVNDTKGWRYRGSDYSFLQQAPHEAYSNEVRKHGNLGAYPMEQIRVNGKHLDIKDVDPADLKGHESHPFDHHPIMEHFETPAGSRTPEMDKQYTSDHDSYQGSPHMDKYFDKHDAMKEADPEGYASRGSKPSAPVHGEVSPLQIQRPEYKSDTATQRTEPASSTAQPSSPKPQVVTRKANKEESLPSHEDALAHAESIKDPKVKSMILKMIEKQYGKK